MLAHTLYSVIAARKLQLTACSQQVNRSFTIIFVVLQGAEGPYHACNRLADFVRQCATV